ncbi:MAG TPA: DUF5047 domain-containing protein [Micromonospora sp.]|nr:DUF5047 domain-containing protein [Micromonospora sp.]
MYDVSDTFLDALRGPHAVSVQLDIWYDGALLLENVEILGGAVTVGSGAGARRTLDVTLADAGLWDTVNVLGAELRPYRGVRYPSGVVEQVPLGVFGLDSMSVQMAPGGGLQVRSAPDRWARVQRAQFENPKTSVRTNKITTEIYRLVSEAVTFDSTSLLTTDTTVVGAVVWDRDRSAAVVDLAESIGAEVFFDPDGNLVIRDVPLLSQVPVWSVDAGASGVMLGGDMTRDRSRMYNVVVASMAAVDGRTPFAPQTAADTDTTSPTYVGGPFGRVPYFYSSPTFRSPTQALLAARAKLLQLKAVNAQVNLSSAVNPALDRGDVITVLTPDGVSELHMIDTVTIPLDVGGVQQITTKSGRPDGDVPAGE